MILNMFVILLSTVIRPITENADTTTDAEATQNRQNNDPSSGRLFLLKLSLRRAYICLAADRANIAFFPFRQIFTGRRVNHAPVRTPADVAVVSVAVVAHGYDNGHHHSITRAVLVVGGVTSRC